MKICYRTELCCVPEYCMSIVSSCDMANMKFSLPNHTPEIEIQTKQNQPSTLMTSVLQPSAIQG